MIDGLQLSPDEAEWIERNRREIERMRQILPPDKFKSFLLRCLDFVREYPDLDAGGDWSLIKEIVWTETEHVRSGKVDLVQEIVARIEDYLEREGLAVEKDDPS